MAGEFSQARLVGAEMLELADAVQQLVAVPLFWARPLLEFHACGGRGAGYDSEAVQDSQHFTVGEETAHGQEAETAVGVGLRGADAVDRVQQRSEAVGAIQVGGNGVGHGPTVGPGEGGRGGRESWIAGTGPVWKASVQAERFQMPGAVPVWALNWRTNRR